MRGTTGEVVTIRGTTVFWWVSVTKQLSRVFSSSVLSVKLLTVMLSVLLMSPSLLSFVPVAVPLSVCLSFEIFFPDS